VTNIYVDPDRQVVFVTVSADLSAMMPGILQYERMYYSRGYAEARLDGK
jgi:hypothetical protein